MKYFLSFSHNNTIMCVFIYAVLLLSYFTILCKTINRKEKYHMIGNRIRELRKNLNMSQEALAEKIGTTQQAVSRMETNAYDIPSDLLIQISKYFNVTTDYILGISDIKRDYNGQHRMNQEMDKCYDIVLRYQNLSAINQRTLRCLLERLEQAQAESNKQSTKDVNINAEDSNM